MLMSSGGGERIRASGPLQHAVRRSSVFAGRGLDVKSQEVVHPGHLCDVGGCESTITAEKEARMDIHKNARTTPHSRAAIVERITRLGESVKGVARAVGICPKTVRKWVARARAGDGLGERSSRPQRVPGATPAELVEHIERLRRQRWTSAEIAERLRLGRSTVARYLARRGLARLRALEPVVPVQRYE